MREANTTDFVFFPSGIFVIEYLCNLRAQLRSCADGPACLLELATA